MSIKISCKTVSNYLIRFTLIILHLYMKLVKLLHEYWLEREG